MKTFDHDKPANRDEWVFASVSRYRELRTEIGKKYAKTHAMSAYTELQDTPPKKAAEKWFKEAS